MVTYIKFYRSDQQNKYHLCPLSISMMTSNCATALSIHYVLHQTQVITEVSYGAPTLKFPSCINKSSSSLHMWDNTNSISVIL